MAEEIREESDYREARYNSRKRHHLFLVQQFRSFRTKRWEPPTLNVECKSLRNMPSEIEDWNRMAALATARLKQWDEEARQQKRERQRKVAERKAMKGTQTMSSTQSFPDYIYATPNQWGSVTIYASKQGMNRTIESLKETGGSDWNGIKLSDCTEYELVGPCNDGSVAYRAWRVRNNQDVLIVRPDDEEGCWFEYVDTLSDYYDDEQLAALGVTL